MKGTLDEDAIAVHEALADLVRVYQFRDRGQICCHDVSVTQCYALETLVRLGPRTLNDVAGALFLDKSTASRVVATLERKGYVASSSHPADGRAVVLKATPSGQRLYNRIRRGLIEQEKGLLKDFTPEARREAARIMSRLARAAESRAGLTKGTKEGCCEPRYP